MPFIANLKGLISSRDIIDRFRGHKQEARGIEQAESHDSANGQLAPLRPVGLPQLFHSHRMGYPDQGWASITINAPVDNLYSCAIDLIEASKVFFDLPTTSKEAFKTNLGSEDGWSSVEGEKELITLRTLEGTPLELKEAASKYWKEASCLLTDLLSQISESLGLPKESLTRYSRPCGVLGQDKTATMLRLFRYEGFEGDSSKIVAEAHRDLGLLSLVIGDKPGLEVWDCWGKSWYALERGYASPAASLLTGRQLEYLTNHRYKSGGHLVRSYPQVTGTITGKYRYSVVFVLRAHSPEMVDTDDLTTSITGLYKNPLHGVTAGEIFANIKAAHFNINTGLEEREAQRRKLAEKRKNQLAK